MSHSCQIPTATVPGSEAARVGMQKGDWATDINGVSTDNKNAFYIIDQIGQDPNAPTITMRVVRKGDNYNDKNKNSADGQDLVMQRSFTKVVDPVDYRLDTRKDGKRTYQFDSTPNQPAHRPSIQIRSCNVRRYCVVCAMLPTMEATITVRKSVTAPR